jgi:Cu+-exporting ATPase
MGVSARVNGKEILIGNGKMMKDSSITASGSVSDSIEKLENEGKTVVVMAVDGKIEGILGVADTVKADSKEAVGKLKKMGIEVYMITGDNQKTAASIALQTGITNVLAEVMPGSKAEEVRKLQAAGKKVGMVGDGINDAPALVMADVGMAIGSGTDIAIESSDITLIRGNLQGVVSAILLSKKTMRKIRQNLFWAFIYNMIGIPFAAFGLLNPVIAGAAMAMSSVSVVTNSLSLKRFKIKG